MARRESELARSAAIAYRWRRWLPAVSLCLGLVACSGGTGSGDNGNGDDGSTSPPAPLGLLKITVTDTFGAAVAGATVVAQQATATVSGETSTDGVALLSINWPSGSAGLTVSRETFVDQQVAMTVAAGQLNQVNVELDRMRAAAGGSLTSRSGQLPAADAAGQQLSFEVEIVVVDADAQAIEGLGVSSFALRACTPDAATDKGDCLRGGDGVADVAYTPVAATPEALEVIAAGIVRPYAAGLLLDQSGSIALSDPTGARLFSAKAFLGSMGSDDQTLVAAFASGTAARIPTPPLATYPPFRGQATASALFPTLDELATLVGGNTPLYQSVDTLREQIVADTTLPTTLPKAVVVFTDGADTECTAVDDCQLRRQQSIQGAVADGLRYFTIGLSDEVDVETLGELANGTGGVFLYAENAEQLLPLYGSVGKLLSLGLPTYRLRFTVQAAAPDSFKPGRKLLGRVQVTHAHGSFDVPFAVGVP